jgi:general secretion pathway protein E
MEERLSAKFLRDAQAVPLREDDDELSLAIADPTDSYVLSAVQMASGKRVRPYIAAPNEIEAALERLYGGGKSSMGQIVDNITSRDEEQDWGDVEHLKDLASEAPVIRLVNLVFTRALESRASDIHIEPFENRLIVRYRIDGVLHEVESPPRRLQAAIASLIKIMAKLNIAERRLPQDGRIKLRLMGKEIDLRVSTLPTLYGESVVLRILDRSSIVLDLELLGFPQDTLGQWEQMITRPYGMILVTGPTGSGKTTTLYALSRAIRSTTTNIITIEDPVEYQLKGINQVDINEKQGLTFASVLRSVLRQDPDVILVGEMRDLETVEAALTLAETGHLTFATLHTSDAVQTINRIVDVFPSHQQQQIRTQLSFALQGVFCQQLIQNSSGKGRVLAAEIMLANSAIRALIRENKGHQIYSQIQTGGKDGMRTMNASLVSLLERRCISQEEVLELSTDKDDLLRMLSRTGTPALAGARR